MCEAAAYLLKEGREELVLENIDLIECEEDQIKLVNIFGEQKKLKAKIKVFSLADHKIILEPM